MEIFGKKIAKKELYDRFGDITQRGVFKSYEFNDGPSKGIRAIDVRNLAGLDFTTLLDRGLDVSNLSYKSIPISWRSATLETNPLYFEPKGDEWLRNFYGGLFVTCGLTSNGFPCIDEGEELNMHGRISNLPAYQVNYSSTWEGDDYKLTISGKLREVKFFGDKLELSRTITTYLNKPIIQLRDKVTNLGSKKSPLMMLYHINLGYPLIDEGAELVESKAKVIPFNDESSKAGYGSFSRFSSPQENFENQLYFHDIEKDREGYANIAVLNKGFNKGQGLGLLVRYTKETLPFLTQWKKLDTGGDYICGLEPANNFVCSRADARKDGTLNFIEPYSEIEFEVDFIVLGSNSEIKNIVERYFT